MPQSPQYDFYGDKFRPSPFLRLHSVRRFHTFREAFTRKTSLEHQLPDKLCHSPPHLRRRHFHAAASGERHSCADGNCSSAA